MYMHMRAGPLHQTHHFRQFETPTTQISYMYISTVTADIISHELWALLSTCFIEPKMCMYHITLWYSTAHELCTLKVLFFCYRSSPACSLGGRLGAELGEVLKHHHTSHCLIEGKCPREGKWKGGTILRRVSLKIFILTKPFPPGLHSQYGVSICILLLTHPVLVGPLMKRVEIAKGTLIACKVSKSWVRESLLCESLSKLYNMYSY